jgi:hypothetical protein
MSEKLQKGNRGCIFSCVRPLYEQAVSNQPQTCERTWKNQTFVVPYLYKLFKWARDRLGIFNFMIYSQHDLLSWLLTRVFQSLVQVFFFHSSRRNI